MLSVDEQDSVRQPPATLLAAINICRMDTTVATGGYLNQRKLFSLALEGLNAVREEVWNAQYVVFLGFHFPDQRPACSPTIGTPTSALCPMRV